MALWQVFIAIFAITFLQDHLIDLEEITEVLVALDGNSGIIIEGLPPKEGIALFLGKTVSFIPFTPTRVGYTFDGWYTSVSGGIKVFDSTGLPVLGTAYVDLNSSWCYSDDITLYAQWVTLPGLCYINDGTSFEGAEYYLYIKDGDNYSQYIPYIHNGTSWEPFG